MIKKAQTLLLVLVVFLFFSGTALAGLTKIGTAAYNGKEYGLIYEDDQNLIWLDYIQPQQPFGVGWSGMMEWAAGLNTPGMLTYKFNPGVKVAWLGSWRLPLTVDGGRTFGYDGTTTAGFNITTSEMGHLFYKSLGNLGYYDKKGNVQEGWAGLKNKGPFVNLQPDSYMSGTEYGINPIHAWDFNMYFGSQGNMWFKPNFMCVALVVCPARVEF
ncbi:MAG: hypothetical protein JW944_14960 [Deltaproteobacteria bacterium]|nr:hypothetical protein [Deltaproteobacteria bacterium]